MRRFNYTHINISTLTKLQQTIRRQNKYDFLIHSSSLFAFSPNNLSKMDDKKKEKNIKEV